MFNVNDYYLGLIFATPSYFENKLNYQRLMNNPESNPFDDLSKEQSMIIGNVVLLKKEGDKYYDEEYSIFEHELSYTLNKPNRLGITLGYVRPFSDYYDANDEELFLYEDMLFEDDILYEATLKSWYVVYYGTSGDYHIVINDTNIMNNVRNDFFNELLGNEYDKIVRHNNPQKKK